MSKEKEMDFIVRVDRSIQPEYPKWIKRIIHPDLELTGPPDYDLQNDVNQWFYSDSCNYMHRIQFYEFLQNNNLLSSCLNLQDGLAIQQKGVFLFQKLFSKNLIFLWSSVGEDSCGNLRVPFITSSFGEVVQQWDWIRGQVISRETVLLFK